MKNKRYLTGFLIITFVIHGTSSMNSTNAFTDQIDTGNATVTSPTKEVLLQLAWIIPTCIGLVFFLLLVALLLYHTIHWVELFVLRMCNKYFCCCNPRVRRREEYKNLQDEECDARFSLQELKARSDKDDKENK
ncbi:hypothetical protein ACJMK2_015644 [Sinanodonta woodiana]|uniref:Uncharacterized protein n=1 Tax=Sinanodonta woodiana TaxID=1069815 RepID=A0ABD3UR22_SINWO